MGKRALGCHGNWMHYRWCTVCLALFQAPGWKSVCVGLVCIGFRSVDSWHLLAVFSRRCRTFGKSSWSTECPFFKSTSNQASLGALPRVRCGWHRPNVHSKHTHSRDTLNRIWQPRYRSVCDDMQTAGRGTQRCWLPKPSVVRAVLW